MRGAQARMLGSWALTQGYCVWCEVGIPAVKHNSARASAHDSARSRRGESTSSNGCARRLAGGVESCCQERLNGSSAAPAGCLGG
jgi:hypothetical protein